MATFDADKVSSTEYIKIYTRTEYDSLVEWAAIVYGGTYTSPSVYWFSENEVTYVSISEKRYYARIPEYGMFRSFMDVLIDTEDTALPPEETTPYLDGSVEFDKSILLPKTLVSVTSKEEYSAVAEWVQSITGTKLYIPSPGWFHTDRLTYINISEDDYHGCLPKGHYTVISYADALALVLPPIIDESSPPYLVGNVIVAHPKHGAQGYLQKVLPTSKITFGTGLINVDGILLTYTEETLQQLINILNDNPTNAIEAAIYKGVKQ